jgi:hypothetical protein
MQSGVQALSKDSNKVFKEDFLLKPPCIILDDSTWRNREQSGTPSIVVVLSIGSFDIFKSNAVCKKSIKGFDSLVKKYPLKI